MAYSASMPMPASSADPLFGAAPVEQPSRPAKVVHFDGVEVADHWRIELTDILAHAVVLTVELDHDIIIGRATDDNPVDVDLGPYGGWGGGVSRRHVLLRPTRNRVHVIELGSSKGTWLNGVQVSRSIALSLSNGDLLTIGQMIFQIRILARPLS